MNRPTAFMSCFFFLQDWDIFCSYDSSDRHFEAVCYILREKGIIIIFNIVYRSLRCDRTFLPADFETIDF